MFNKLILSNEKAVVGGVSAGILTLLSQVGVNGQMTFKEAVYAIVAWLGTHLMVYVTTNSAKSASSQPTSTVAPLVPVDPAATDGVPTI